MSVRSDALAPSPWIAPPQWEGTAFAVRRAFFERCQHTHGDGCVACPVCGYPTLHRRCCYDMCSLCQWECDGQDDPEADAVWGGPNARVSLSQARCNFEPPRSMWPPEEAVPGGPHRYEELFSESAMARKNHLCALYEGLMALTAQQEVARQWERIRATR